MNFKSLVTLVCITVFVASCHRGPVTRFAGQYVNPDHATLAITDEKITGTIGPMSIAANYKIAESKGDDFTLLLSGPGEPGVTAHLRITPTGIAMSGGPFSGQWTKK